MRKCKTFSPFNGRCLQPSAWKFTVMCVRQIVCFETTILYVTTFPFTDWRLIIQSVSCFISLRGLEIRKKVENSKFSISLMKRTYLVCKNGHNKFSRLKNFNHTCNQVTIVGCCNVTLKTDIREIRFRSNVNGHVASLEIFQTQH